MRKSGGILLLSLGSILGILVLSASVWAGEDKGTIGITCRAPGSNSRYDLTSELKGQQALRAEEDFRSCVRKVVERWSDNEIKQNLLMLEKTVDQRDAGVDPLMIEGYSTYRNVIEEVKAERKKASKKDDKKPAANPAPKK